MYTLTTDETVIKRTSFYNDTGLNSPWTVGDDLLRKETGATKSNCSTVSYAVPPQVRDDHLDREQSPISMAVCNMTNVLSRVCSHPYSLDNQSSCQYEAYFVIFLFFLPGQRNQTVCAHLRLLHLTLWPKIEKMNIQEKRIGLISAKSNAKRLKRP